ncbi:protein FAR1-RELATED SEQUENCE 4-like [Cucumis melo var. makuwa]|uniref:Protein FAR1-RELATED SEQUENCE 4-like n=1 Tax=Cucumis melo var. makuwa TaxID=1194695 RepID=A0A5A7UHW9_CUCMM|nr:protein FAR1-RELATED SEQUENCE 4-like [Cucumis melo var. makuwa]
MGLQRVKTVFDGRWIESSRYIDYRLLDVYVPVSSPFQEFVNCIQRRLFPNLEVSVSRLTVYWTNCNNSNLIRIVDDKDVSDTVFATDIGNTPYLSSELPRTEDSHSENGIIDLNAFESSHTGSTSSSNVINYMKIHHEVNVSYDKAWRGREIALNSIRGTPEDSYAMVSAFSDALIRNNLGMSWKLLEDIGGLGHFLGENDTRLLQPTSLKFYERHTKWSFQRTELSIYAEDMIRESLRESRSMNIYPVDQHEFEVHHPLSTRNLNLHLYIDKFYYVSNLINLYKKGTRPIGSVNQIRNMHQGGNDGILPP